MKRAIVLLLSALISFPAPPLHADAPPGAQRPSPALFTNVTAAAGLSGVLGDSYAWGDYDSDGDDDLLIKGYRLFRNNGPPAYDFTEVTSEVGIGADYGYGVWGDYNNDGHLDFYCVGHNESFRDTLWRNTGPPDYRFVNASAEAGGMDDGYRPSLACSWLDYDRDGFLDIYVMNWRDANNKWYEDVLWHNNRDGTFSQVTRAAGVLDYSPAYAGMGVCAADYNNDGWPDIYASNYLLAPNYLWHNNHDGTFTDLGSGANASGDPDYYIDGTGPYYGHTAGSCWGDYDNDGDLDLWVGNLAHKDMGTTQRALICDDPMLLRNLGFPYRFEDFRERAGIPTIPNGAVQDGQWRDDDTFGGAWADFDSDGWLDLYVPEVKGYHSWAHSHLWHNNGDGTFTDVGQDAGIRIWAGIGCAWADYNNDGQPDHVTEGCYPYQGPRELHLFRNGGTSNSWLKIRLVGTESNRAAIGARLTAWDGSMAQTREVEGGTGGHAHQSSLTQHFGFGSHGGSVSVLVRWPSGIVQNLTVASLNQTVTITEAASGPRILSLSASSTSPAEGEAVTFTASTSGSPATFMWDFEGDGQVDSVLGSGEPVQHSYTRPGLYYPSLRVMNAAGTLGEEESLILSVRNVPPVARAGGDRRANESEPLLLDGSASTDTQNDVPLLEYNWTFEDGWFSGWARSPLAARVLHQSTVVSGRLYVRDDDGEVSSDDFRATIVNLPPQVSMEPPGLAAEDSPIELRAEGRDTEGDLPGLRYIWDFGDGSPGSGPQASPRATHTYTASGVYTATVTVRDDDGAAASASANVTVANLPPSGEVELESVETEEDARVTLRGSGLDTPSDIGGLSYMWDFGDGNSSEWSREPSAAHVYTASGAYTATLVVRDGDGATASARCCVTVQNLAPSCRVASDWFQADEDAPVELEGEGLDTPTDSLSLTYMWDFDDGNLSQWSPFPAATHAYARSGSYRPRLTVRDNDGAEAHALVEVEVRNLPPTASARAPRTSVEEDAPVELNASGSSDTPSDIGLLHYRWDFGDGSSAEGARVNHSYPKKKRYTVVLTVTDDDGESATAELSISVRNVDPWVSASASAPRALVGEALNFTAEAGDTPSDAQRLRCEWSFGDGGRGSGSRVSHVYQAPGRYRAKVTVTDDDGASAEAAVEVEVVEAARQPLAEGPGGPPLAAFAAALGIALAAAAVAALTLLRRKGRRGTAGPPEGGGGLSSGPPEGERGARGQGSADEGLGGPPRGSAGPPAEPQDGGGATSGPRPF
ncbi:MAG: PKD domain-containing protein [Thermoplasmatota archaeon]